MSKTPHRQHTKRDEKTLEYRHRDRGPRFLWDRLSGRSAKKTERREARAECQERLEEAGLA